MKIIIRTRYPHIEVTIAQDVDGAEARKLRTDIEKAMKTGSNITIMEHGAATFLPYELIRDAVFEFSGMGEGAPQPVDTADSGTPLAQQAA